MNSNNYEAPHYAVLICILAGPHDFRHPQPVVPTNVLWQHVRLRRV